MRILGLLPFGYNPSACILVDGVLEAFAEEDRLIGIKGAVGCFPERATRLCLERTGSQLADVDALAIGWDVDEYLEKVPRLYAARDIEFPDRGDETRAWEAQAVRFFHPVTFRKFLVDGFRRHGFRGDLPPVEFVGHHFAHAVLTYASSGFEESAVLTLDGSGETEAAVLWKARGEVVERMRSYELPKSLGWFYSAITQFLGFRHNFDEGKTMGLAPYGAPNDAVVRKMDAVLRVEGEDLIVDPSAIYWGPHYPGKGFSRRLCELFGEPRFSGEPIEQRHKDVAWAAQDVLERAAVELARVALRDSGATRLCLAGGVTMNCKMNGEIIRHTKPVASFIHPASGDSGTAIGAALVVHQRLCGNLPRRPMRDAYLGPEFSEGEIRGVLEECRLKYQRPADIAATAAGLLARGKIIGWFQGRLEAGARALGHRSILANAADPAMKEKINAQVKHREMWRPFCPSILRERQAEWLESGDDAPYMIRAMNVLPGRWDRVPSVVHVDGSVRPQSVAAEREGLYWSLLRHFEAETGVPLILNTSFNVRGAPIVCNPTDAIRCFFSTGLDAMALGPFLIEK